VSANRVGDAVLSTGLLDHLIRTRPAARFTIVCGPAAEGVFTRMPQRERTIVLHKRRFDAHWLELWAWSAARRWDLVVDLRGSALAWMVRARERRVMRPRPGHKIAQLAAVLGLSDPPAPVAWTAPEDESAADRLLPPAAALIALGPTANWRPKTWAAERFAALFDMVAPPGAVPLVLGGPGPAERALAAPLLAALPQAVDLVGRLSLPETAAVLRRAALFVGNDSGLMHLAAAAGAPTLGLFGPTPADEYAPVGRRAAALSSEDGTMVNIPVARAAEAAFRLMGRGPAGGNAPTVSAGAEQQVGDSAK